MEGGGWRVVWRVALLDGCAVTAGVVRHDGIRRGRAYELGTARSTRAHTAITRGVSLARLLNDPKVTKPF